MASLRVALLTRSYPFVRTPSGEMVYTRGLIAAMTAAGIDVAAACPAPTNARELLENPSARWTFLDGPVRNRWLSLFSDLPPLASRYAAPQLVNEIEMWLAEQKADVVLFDHLSFGHVMLGTHGASGALVYLSHNDETGTAYALARNEPNPAIRSVHRLNARKTERLENDVLRRADLVTTITDHDRLAMAPRRGDGPIETVDPVYLNPCADFTHLNEREPIALLLGSFIWSAKRDNLIRFLTVADELWPKGRLRLRIVGLMDDQLKHELKDRFPWAEVIGPVDDVRPELASARIGIVPEVTGGGFKLKLLDYVFNGVAVAGVTSGMEGFRSEACLRAVDLQDLVEQIADNWTDTDMLTRLTERARDDLQGLYDVRATGTKLHELFASLRRTDSPGLPPKS